MRPSHFNVKGTDQQRGGFISLNFRSRIAFLFVVILTTQVLTQSSFSQINQVRFQHLQSEQGLSQATVRCIFQDHKGFLWIGTQDGLNKYDGYAFTVFRHDQENQRSLSNNSVATIYEDREGTLWIGTTGGGLNRFNRETEDFTHYRHDPANAQSLSHDAVSSIYQARSGALWLGTNNGLDLFNRERETFTTYQHDPANPQSLGDNLIRAIAEDETGALWLGTNDSGLEKFDSLTGEFRHYRYEQNNAGNQHPIAAMSMDKQGALWIGTEGSGVYKFDRRTEQFTLFQHTPKIPSSLADNIVRAIYEDHTGVLWFGTNAGLDSFDGEKSAFIHYRHDAANPESLSDNTIFSLFEDKSGVLWIGTGTGGVSKLNRSNKPFATYRSNTVDPHSLSSNVVFAFLEDSAGGLWIGTVGGGLNLYDRKTGEAKRYQHDPFNPHSLSNNFIYSILEDKTGALWIGTGGGGLERFDRKTERFTHYQHDPANPRSLCDDTVWVVYQDRSGTLWNCTANGLDRFDSQTETFTHYQHDSANPRSLSNNNIRAILEDPAGALWLGTRYGGLEKLDRQTGEFTHYAHDQNNPSSLSSDAVYFLHEDASNVLWVGTTEGLNQFDPARQTFIHFAERDGLANNTVYGILSDRQGNLWLSTNQGISKFNTQSHTFRNYDANSGLQGNEFNGGAAFQSASGEMFFGGISGFNSFFPEQINDSSYKPPIVLTAFKKFDQKVELGKPLDEVGELELSYKDNVFSFEFAALDYAAPQKNQYAYMLEGFDHDWNYSGTRRVAIYTNLDGGNYTFKVKGTNSDGIWNDQIASVRIKVVPPPWKTWWFLTLSVGAIALVGIVAYRRRISRLHQARAAQENFSRQLIESQETERKRIAGELHDSLGQNLLIIKNRALLGLSANEDDKHAAIEQLGEISAMASQSLDEVREIARNLHPYQLDRLGLTKALESVIRRAASSSEINFTTQLDSVNNLFSKEAEINLYRIVQECVNNILRHSRATEASLFVERGAHDVRIEIKDNGAGFNTEPVTGEDLERRGFGLAGINERARILGAKHMIRSTPGRGTTVILKIELPDGQKL